MHPEPTLFDMDWQGVVLLRVSLLTHLWEGHSQATANPLMMMGYPRIRPSQMGPPEGGVGAEEAKVAGAVVTLMGPTPLGGDIRKRMDFQVKSRSPNSGARRAMLMMWPAPLGSGPAASPTVRADPFGDESSQEDDEGLFIPSYLEEALPNDPVLQVKMAHATWAQEVETRRCFTCNQQGHLQRDHWKYEEKNRIRPLQPKGSPLNKLAQERVKTKPPPPSQNMSQTNPPK